MNNENKELIYDLFLSYSRKDKEVIKSIKKEIEGRLGLNCWVDLSNIPCGTENFKRKVIPGIKNTRIAFLFFLSKFSQASENAMKEINFAKKREKKRVVLIRFNDDEMTDEFFFDYQDADVIDWRVVEQKEKLFKDLKNWAQEQNVYKIQGVDVCDKSVKPTKDVIETVTEKIAHFLFAKKDWREFSVIEFESSTNFIQSFVVKDSVGTIVRMLWLNTSDFHFIANLDGIDSQARIEDFYNKSQIDGTKDIQSAWDELDECIMPVVLFAYDIRGRISEKSRSQILIPIRREELILDKARTDVCVRECNGIDSMCVVLDASRLSQLIGKNRVECSEYVIKWLKGS
jgi:hypothetical protein